MLFRSLRHARSEGQKIAAVVNVPTSSMAREADLLLPTHAGPEIGVASTKAFTSQVTVLALLTLALGRQRQMSRESGIELARELDAIPAKIQAILERREVIAKIAPKMIL